MKYTIELDNDEGQAEIRLIDGIICAVDALGDIQSTGVHSTIDTFGRDVYAMYGAQVWDLQIED